MYNDEICDALDHDYDRRVDEDSLCSRELESPCYGGLPSTRGLGLCKINFPGSGSRGCVVINHLNRIFIDKKVMPMGPDG